MLLARGPLFLLLIRADRWASIRRTGGLFEISLQCESAALVPAAVRARRNNAISPPGRGPSIRTTWEAGERETGNFSCAKNGTTTTVTTATKTTKTTTTTGDDTGE